MKEFSTEQIQGQFEKLPADLQAAITSPEIHDKIEAIGKRYSLMLDQLGELVDEIGLILLGLEKSSNFVSRASRRLGISSKAATMIGQDVNKEIFDAIKDSLRKVEVEVPSEQIDNASISNQTVSEIESAGNFSVEKDATQGDGSPDLDQITYADRAKILDGVENPPANLGPDAPNFPSSADLKAGTAKNNHTEPLVDYLLSNATGQGKKDVVVQPPSNLPVSPAPTVAPKRTGPDPYREEAK